MKKLIINLTVIAGLALASHGVGLYVPQGNSESLGFSPLNKGELCWIPNVSETETDEDGNVSEVIKTATLYIGNETVEPYRVIDPGALRGTVTKTLDYSEFSIGTDPYWTTTGDGTYTTYHTDTWMDGTNSVTAATGTVYITVSSKYVIDKISYDIDTPSMGMFGNYQYDVDRKDSGNKITLTITSDDGCSWIKISDIGVTVREIGEAAYVNDLTARTWLLKDQYGQFDFANLRYWATHLYDGNRGEHWADYQAINNVYLNEHKIYFDGSNKAVTVSCKDKKLNFSMWGINAMQIIEGTSTNVYTGTLDITAVDKQNSTYRLTYLQAILKDGVADFDPTQLIVKYAPQLETNKTGDIPWEYLVNGQDFTVTDYGDGTGVVDIPYNITNDKGFYRLVYKGVMSEIMRIEFNTPVIFNSDVILKSPNGNKWKLKVDNNGNLSTEAVAD